MALKPQILIAEDDSELREALKKVLALQNLTIFMAEDGLDAIRKCRNQSFDAILIDITMPKLNGVEAIKLIRESKLNAQTPIIVLSGTLNQEILLSIRKDISKVFSKPADLEKVVAYLSSLLG